MQNVFQIINDPMSSNCIKLYIQFLTIAKIYVISCRCKIYPKLLLLFGFPCSGWVCAYSIHLQFYSTSPVMSFNAVKSGKSISGYTATGCHTKVLVTLTTSTSQ